MVRFKAAAVISVLLMCQGLAACNQCEALEEKLCGDLGAADCALWRKYKGPDALYSGRRQNRFCMNARFGSTYDAMLTGAKAVVASAKLVEAKKPK
jgi:hypothetical protein